MGNGQRLFVLSLGGSLITPDAVDVSFLLRFKQTLLSLMDEGFRFIVIPGGGATARAYQRALGDMGISDAVEQDRIGISALKLNAQLLRALFADYAYPHVITNNAQLPEEPFALLIAAGSEPGRSSDAGAVELAQAAGASTVINLSNIAHVYARDPRENPEAESYVLISWEEYRALIPPQWDPGLSTPFDPVASEMAQRAGLAVAILDGSSDTALTRFIREGICEGTLIGPR